MIAVLLRLIATYNVLTCEDFMTVLNAKLLLPGMLGLSLMAGVVTVNAKPPIAQPTNHTPKPAIANPAISYDAFTKSVVEVGKLRQTRRISEAEFMAMAADKNTVILDARSAAMYARRHVRGAVNLSLPDFSEAALKAVIPSKTTRVVIYCNNNFTGDQISMVSKSVGSSLNLPTFVALNDYGYRNVYELAPLLDLKTTKIPFAGTHLGLTRN
jgi:Rhodanese-like domain